MLLPIFIVGCIYNFGNTLKRLLSLKNMFPFYSIPIFVYPLLFSSICQIWAKTAELKKIPNAIDLTVFVTCRYWDVNPILIQGPEPSQLEFQLMPTLVHQIFWPFDAPSLISPQTDKKSFTKSVTSIAAPGADCRFRLNVTPPHIE